MTTCPECGCDLSDAPPVETEEEDHCFDAMENVWHDWKVVRAFCHRCVKMVELSRSYMGSRDRPKTPS